jgi:glutathione S-transferase
MSRTFYYGSGSPYAWKVWLALEHKQLAYDLRVLSFDNHETRAPEFLAINPRGKVPALVDDGLVLTESNAIAEYLEDRYPERPLMPREPALRAHVRRVTAEVDSYFAEAVRSLRPLVFAREPATPDALAAGRERVLDELARLADHLGDREHFAGALSLADFAVYPHVRLLLRFDQRTAGLDVAARLPAPLQRWQARLAALPYHDRTLPPHWRA